MLNIAFWNINKKNISDLIASFTLENDVDILCIAEAESQTIPDFIQKINIISTSKYVKLPSAKSKVTILSRLDTTKFTDRSSLYNSNRLVAFNVKISTKIDLNLIAVHFHSKNNWTDISLAMECVTLANAVSKVEEDTENTNTILIGDFNMNPFEGGMVASNGLHAVPDLEYASKNINGRIIDDTGYPFFYNPMWNFFGDHTQPLGTYYYRSPGSVSYEWHIFDQILLRPSLKKYLGTNYIDIVTKVGTESLVDNLNRPDKLLYSDHLPVLLKLKM